MKKWLPYYIAILLFTGYELRAQPVIRTEIPENPVTVGEPFRIQFVIENSDNKQRFAAPDFYGLKIIRGPELYSGSQFIRGKKTAITNYVYTAVAERIGNFKIGAASVSLNGLIYPGNELLIVVLEKRKLNTSKKGDDITGYVLMPGEDPYQKITENLFVKLFVDRRSCFVGEPVVATFKLFSRLESKSEIIKNPGFYGFSVHDMISLDDKEKTTEKVNGKNFDVHTIRKVQLYPLTAGDFIIDAMKIDNKVKFSRSMVSKKTEQEISEGILNRPEDDTNNPGTEIFETSLSTAPVTVKVSPLPSKTKPADFNGATGKFTIKSTIEKNELDKNEEGFLIIKVDGKGNFTQITAPHIQWPAEIEGFEPSVKDELDKRNVPLSGSRVFKYPFISSRPGKWVIPAVKFSFFNSDSNKYRSISTDSFFVMVSDKEFKKKEIEPVVNGEKKISIEAANRKASRIAFTLVALLVAGVVCYLLIKERKSGTVANVVVPEIKRPSVDEIFAPLNQEENISADKLYELLNQSTWTYLTELYQLSGTEMNKNSLAQKMKQAGNNDELIFEVNRFLTQFETAMFTAIETEENRRELIDKTKTVLKEIKS